MNSILLNLTTTLKSFRISLLIFTLSLAMGFISCSKDDGPSTPDPSTTIEPGNDPNFKIVANTDTGFGNFNRKVVVFDIPIYAVKAVEDNKLLHAANLMAQYLDNDEDGIIDNVTIHNSMKTNKAFLFMWKTEAEQGQL